MKRFIPVLTIGFLIIACNNGGDDSSPAAENNAPTKPELTVPTDNKLCVDNSVGFEWKQSTDADGDPIVYQIQVARDNQFSQIVKEVEGTATIQTVALDKNTAYYWRVKAIDSKRLSGEYSTTFKLYTTGEAVVNHVPFLPELLQPVLNSNLNTSSATLSWNASDVDSNDVLRYDVYFGTVNPPTQKVGDNLAAKTFNVSVSPANEYFWKVVVKDNKGGETTGQIWKFKTN